MRPAAPGCRPANFYPRSPCGERLALDQYLNEQEVFLSTLSLRRATGKLKFNIGSLKISIHALLAESDAVSKYIMKYINISIHALLAESDFDFEHENAIS